MKAKVRNLMFAAATVASLTVTASAAEGWATSYVKFVYPLASGDFIVGLVDSPSTCTNANNPKYLLVGRGENSVTADGVKGMLATSLSAFLSGKGLTVVFDDSTSSCSINRMQIAD